MQKKENTLLVKIRESIRKKEPIAEIYLYGSRARGDFKKDSDWDILVLSANEDFLQVEDSFREDIYHIELESGQIISLLTYSKKYWNNTLSITPLYKTILKEGIRI